MVKDYHEVFAAVAGCHREAYYLIEGKVFSDLDGLDEYLVASDLEFASVKNWWWRGGVTIFVDQTFCLVFLRYPFAVARDLGRCLGTSSDVSPGHVVKYPALMVFVQVDTTELKAA